MTTHIAWLSGIVIHGDGRGNALGFPTANLDVPASGCADGVYAAWARIGDEPRWRQATTSIGDNPTFGDVTETRVEAHIHDFSGDLYGMRVELQLVALIRGMTAFDDVDTLISRTADDLIVAERLLATVAPPDHRGSRAHRATTVSDSVN
ncbi:riboflavin kinase/FMN adenylyltransferase [Microterricola gilva]|uniref:riboflavin kinase n=1 Tax=Microterricola gilva TaxID=393267 RepID=A0A4Q8AM40_9MICO|nr:riboflavin kinase [Microterricola gilva]RZU65637.1 riboflavin kinase/FMN adenylyltransferase [Microterricola gilva]